MVQKLLCKTHKKTFNIKNDPLHSPHLYKKKPQHVPSFQFLLPVLKPRSSLNGLARFSSMCPTQPTNHRNRCTIYTHLLEANNVTILGPLSLIPHLFPQAHWGRKLLRQADWGRVLFLSNFIFIAYVSQEMLRLCR